MASPVGFEGAGQLITAPVGQEDIISDLPVFKNDMQMVSCWRLSVEELKEIARTGVVWLGVAGTVHPAVRVSGEALVYIIEDDGTRRVSKAEPNGVR